MTVPFPAADRGPVPKHPSWETTEATMADTTTSPHFANLAAVSTAMLTTFRRSGRAVSTPVSIVVDGEAVYFVTAVDSGKAKRLAHTDAVTLAPCTTGGRVLGDAVAGRARAIDAGAHRRVLRPTRPLLWSYLLYRLRGRAMRVYRVVPVPSTPAHG